MDSLDVVELVMECERIYYITIADTGIEAASSVNQLVDIIYNKKLKAMKEQKVTIIVGKQSSGKTTKAREMVANKNAVWIPSFYLAIIFGLSSVTEETDVIVIEDLTFPLVEYFKRLIAYDVLTIDKTPEMSINNRPA